MPHVYFVSCNCAWKHPLLKWTDIVTVKKIKGYRKSERSLALVSWWDMGEITYPHRNSHPHPQNSVMTEPSVRLSGTTLSIWSVLNTSQPLIPSHCLFLPYWSPESMCFPQCSMKGWFVAWKCLALWSFKRWAKTDAVVFFTVGVRDGYREDNRVQRKQKSLTWWLIWAGGSSAGVEPRPQNQHHKELGEAGFAGDPGFTSEDDLPATEQWIRQWSWMHQCLCPWMGVFLHLPSLVSSSDEPAGPGVCTSHDSTTEE